MLSNAYFLAKFRFDTAQNEPAKNLQDFANFANFADPNPHGAERSATGVERREPAEPGVPNEGQIKTHCPATNRWSTRTEQDT